MNPIESRNLNLQLNKAFGGVVPKKKRKRQQKRKRTVTADNNRMRVREAFLVYYNEHNKPPTNKQLAEETGLSYNAVCNILNSLSFSEFFVGMQKRMVPLADDMIMTLYKKGMTGDTFAIKLFFQLLGWAEKTESKEKKEIAISVTQRIIDSSEKFKEISKPGYVDAEFEVVDE